MKKRLKKKLLKKLIETIPEGYGIITKARDKSFYHSFKKGEIVRFESFNGDCVEASSLSNRDYIQFIPLDRIMLNLGGGQVG
ncbi:hypothetical protein ACP8H2_09490 [Bacillus subtilis]|uniref:hypothetical protein n=1 Tax=Bacillus subtilis TaxID=1423 RepID=UPI003CF3DDDE